MDSATLPLARSPPSPLPPTCGGKTNSGSFLRAWSAAMAKRGGEGASRLKRCLTSSGIFAGRRVSVLMVTHVLQAGRQAGNNRNMQQAPRTQHTQHIQHTSAPCKGQLTVARTTCLCMRVLLCCAQPAFTPIALLLQPLPASACHSD